MKIRLIATDMDGTFLDDEKQIPEANWQALLACAARGIQIVPATGRTVRGIPDRIRTLPGVRYAITTNGAVVAEWSHNQGMAGDFWPYTVYSYNSGTDTYEQTAMVDAWDKSVGEKDYEGNSFPDDIDADGDGLVYYIMPGGTYEKNTPVDFEEYTKWRESSIGQAQPLEIPYLELTEENIQKL